MKVLDVAGEIREGMWNYEPPFPRFGMKPLGRVPWVEGRVYCEVFEGLHSQTGTYLETPAHYYGNDRCYLVDDIPVEKLVDIPLAILSLDFPSFEVPLQRLPITADMLASCPGAEGLPENCAISVGTGWGRYWMDSCYLKSSPYFTYEAMKWLISKKPFLLCSDVPRWENLEHPEGFFGDFFAADILMLAPCVNLEKLTGTRGRLTALPLRIPGTSCVPCRAVIIEED